MTTAMINALITVATSLMPSATRPAGVVSGFLIMKKLSAKASAPQIRQPATIPPVGKSNKNCENVADASFGLAFLFVRSQSSPLPPGLPSRP